MYTICFTISSIDNVYNVQVPRLQLVKGSDSAISAQMLFQNKNVNAEEDKRILKKEIKLWWQSVSDHMDALVSIAPRSYFESRLTVL